MLKEQTEVIGKYSITFHPDVQWAVVTVEKSAPVFHVTPVYEEDGPDAFENCKRWAEKAEAAQ